MAESERARKTSDPAKAAKAAKPPEKKPPTEAPPVAQRMPSWPGTSVSAPFPLAGVQRKIQIGPSNDAYERQADQVANQVTGGGRVAPDSISSIAPAGIGQRQSKDEKKEPASASPVQREVKPEDRTKDARAAMPVQKQTKPEEKQDKTPSPVQRETKPKDTKQDGDAKAPAVQRSGKGEKEKREDKLPPAVQREVRPEDKKKIERDWSAPLQRKANPEEKDKSATPPPVQRETKPKEDKKSDASTAPPVQRANKPEEKKKDDKPAASTPIQKQAKPEQKKKEEPSVAAPVQREETKQAPKQEHESVQTSRGEGGAAAAPSMENAAAHAIANKGAGEPITPATRGALESGMGTDLSDVRVHTDSRAHEASDALNARAFTHQNDIWLGRGESQSDTHLMAHEATHVVQQTGSVHRQLVQRATPPTASAAPATPTPSATSGDSAYSGKEGEVKKTGASFALTIPKLQIPTFKLDKTPKSDLKLPKKTDEPRPDDQRDVWEKDVRAGTGIDTKLDKKLKEEKAPSLTKGGQPIFFTEIRSGNFYVIGNQTTIKNRSLRPSWDKSGAFELYQVDHIQEIQLGGANIIDNMWLLEAEANQSSGREIRAEKNRRIQSLLDAATGKAWDKTPDIDVARREYDITFQSVVGGLPIDGKPAKRWTLEEIKNDARQLDELKVLNKAEIERRGLKGSASKVVVYTNEAGGGMRASSGWKEGEKEKPVNWYYGKLFHANRLRYDKDAKTGSLHVDAFEGSKLIKKAQMDFDIQEMDAVDYGGYVSRASVKKGISDKLEALGLSPIELPDGEFTENGLVARGKLKPSIRPFDKLEVDIVFDGDNIYLSKVLSAADFNFPGPIKATSASLELCAGTQGVGARGSVAFAIEKVGHGKISAGASLGEGLSISGDFDFDTNMFDPSKVHVEYTKGKFSGAGQIGIKPGKVRGINSASIEASFTEEVIDAKGSIVPDIPAVEKADLAMHYDEKSGLTIGGDLQLKKDIPGIADGSIHAEVNKKEDKYVVKAHGEATPKIPGISSKLIVNYDDGAFDATVTAGYEKGMLKGSVTVGATNRPVDDSGKPGEVPAAKADKITLYGGGSVTLQLAPWLQATVIIKFKPDGDVQVTGKIGLPSVLDIFDEKKVDKNIFKIGIYIPIVPGVALNVGGGLDLSAGIGPGQLQEVEVDVTYDPAKEDETNVHGHAALHIPAHAGLRMNVHAALDVGIPLADVEGGIELGGTMGIEGALHAGVDIDWTPKRGLVLDASAEIYGEPKFKFDITGYVKVEVGIGWLSKTLWEHKWELAAVEYGSGLRLGLKLPVHYEEGKPFNVALSDIQFQVPEVDPMSVLKGLIDKIA